MEPASSHSKTIQHQFDCFCKKVLREEARDYYRQQSNLGKYQISLDDLTPKEDNQLCTMDEYFAAEKFFRVLDYDIAIQSDVIAEALKLLPDGKRDIILLSYFLDMSDKEIGERLNIVRRTIQYKRTAILLELKRILEDCINEAEE